MEYEIIELPETQTPVVPQGTSGGIGRDIGRTVARGAESLIGLPGDISSGVLGLANLGIKAATGKENILPSEIPYVPTSKDVRGVTKKLTGEYLEPQTEKEQLYDEVVGDLASFLVPVKGKIPLKGALTRAIGGNLASYLTKQVGGGEGAQTGAKLGFNLISSLAGGKQALKKQMKESYAAAESSAKGAVQPAKELANKLTKSYDQLNEGLKSPWKKEVKDHLTSISNSVSKKTGSIPVDKAWSYKKELNDLIFDPKTDKHALPFYKKTVNELNGVLKDYAKKNPEFGREFTKAEDIYRGLAQKTKVTNFLEKHVNIDQIVKNPFVKSLFLGSAYHISPATLPGSVAAVGTGYTAREGSKLFDFLKESKEARTYYKNAIQASLAGNVKTATKNLIGLDKEADKYEPVGDYEVISL